MRRRTHQQTMVMKQIARGSRIDSMFEHVPAAWGELKAVALMLPHPRVLEGPIDPHWLFQCAAHLQLDITPDGGDHQLLPFVIALARAPLPAHWYALSPNQLTKDERLCNPKWFEPPPSDLFVYPNKRAEQARRLGLSVSSPPSSPASSPAPVVALFRPPPPAAERDWLDVYENTMTRERRYGHPGANLVLPTVRGLQRRTQRTLKPSSVDGWVQFVDVSGEPFFYNFRTKARLSEFPHLSRTDVPPSVLPPRKLEPCAEQMFAAGETLLSPSLSYPDAVCEARRLLYEPRKAARAVQLASAPCPMDELLINAQYLGLNAAEHAELMFLVDAMLTPELPCGWLRRAAPGMAAGDEFYWHALLGWAQWEHPQVSLLSGVAAALKQRLKDHTASLQRDEANPGGGAVGARALQGVQAGRALAR